jgi:hypothetical protein
VGSNKERDLRVDIKFSFALRLTLGFAVPLP